MEEWQFQILLSMLQGRSVITKGLVTVDHSFSLFFTPNHSLLLLLYFVYSFIVLYKFFSISFQIPSICTQVIYK